ncbi:hypothetical protein Asp14428_05620 [Actinoplanes sp. NBRC 14428]|nr:hypothetical protein Asp14428_05620 [Actinoplanes sp. NBRC 14428]
MPGAERETRLSHLLRLSGFAATAATPLFAAAASQASGADRWKWAAASAVAALYVAVATYLVQRQLKAAAAAAADRLDSALGKVAPPLIDTLHDLCLAPDVESRSKAMGHLQAVVLDSARTCGDADTRAALYLLSNHRPHRSGECLVRERHRGRNDPPRERFCSANGDEDKEVLKMTNGTRIELYPDIRSNPPRGVYNAKERVYRSLMFVPVRTRKKSFGMLSVDHPRQKVFTDSDKDLLIVLANSLGVAMAITEDAAARAGQETVKAQPASSRRQPQR